jgi:hypothetical protein
MRHRLEGWGFVEVGFVGAAFLVDGSRAGLCAGPVAARHLQTAHGVVEEFDAGVDDRGGGGSAQDAVGSPAVACHGPVGLSVASSRADRRGVAW